MTTYRVSELAELVGLPPSTLRFYDQVGLVPARRSASGYRLFDDQAVKRVGLITTGKRLGLPLEEIRELLGVWEDGLCRDVRERLRPMVLNQMAGAEQRAAEIDAYVERLREALAVIESPAPAGRCAPGCGMVPDQDPATAAPAAPAPPAAPSAAPLSSAVAPPAAAAHPAADRLTAWVQDGEPPPIACLLEAADQGKRVEEWRRLLARADAREPIDGGLAFRFAPALAGAAAELAVAEQRCCGFLEFNLRLAANGLRLEVRVPDEAVPLLAGIFGTAGPAS
jgi:DNA-binding transcriptional MerR regulator